VACQNQLTGATGVYLVAAELSRRGFITSVTSRSDPDADILVTDQRCQRAYSVEVKTNRPLFDYWLVGEPAQERVSPTHFYVLVNLRDGETEYFVVPSQVVSEKTYVQSTPKGTWYSFSIEDAKGFQDRWDLFGSPDALRPRDPVSMPFVRQEIAAMAGYVPGEQPQESGFIKLNTNENPYPPSPAVRAAIDEVLRRGLQKYPDPMAGAFRRRAAELLGVEPDWILCGNGSDDILTIATRTFVGQGDLLRLPYPSYVLYTTLAQIQGARSEEVPFEPDWSLSPRFASAADGLRLVFLPNPNSPSGTVVPPETVLALAEQLPCPLLVDEAYADFAERNCMDLVARCEKILVSRSLSKSYALAGLRFGYVVAQPHLIREMVKVKDSYNCDALSIAAATAAIGDQAWLDATRAKILATRRRMTSAMRNLGFVTVDSQANFTWNVHPERPARPLYEELKRHRILVRYMDYPGWGDGLRITVGTDDEIDACLDCLQKLV